MLIKSLKPGLIILGLFHVAVVCFSQEINMTCKDMPLEQVFKEVQKQTDYVFIYEVSQLKNRKLITIKASKMPLKTFLTEILSPGSLAFDIDGKNIFISKKIGVSNSRITDTIPGKIRLIGKVIDEDGDPLENASVTVKKKQTGTRTDKSGTKTDKYGVFQLEIIADKAASPDEPVVVITCVGFEPVELKSWDTDIKIIKLKVALSSLQEVVVNTGMFERKKSSYTGAVNTYTGEDLMNISKLNIIEGLKTLDPSIVVWDNNNFGSDPNKLPEVELRGRTGIRNTTGTGNGDGSLRTQFQDDPNRPLFILDGFEVTLEEVVSLDMTRIAAVTLLKDAASTSLYGSRASNGVIVIETIKPKPGSLQVNYSMNGIVQIPDLTGYNIMNAEEFTLFRDNVIKDYLSRMSSGEARFPGVLSNKIRNDSLRQLALAGLNTDWLRVPVRTGFTTNHALSIMGGDAFFRYSAGLNYRSVNGVMKGSANKTVNGNIRLSYAKGIINVTNLLTIMDITSENGSYGSFKDWVAIPPYYEQTSAQNRYLENQVINTPNRNGAMVGELFQRINPEYIAALPFLNESKDQILTNNLMAQINVLKNLRMDISLQYSRKTGRTEIFTSPLHPSFDAQPDATLKGRYDYAESNQSSYTGRGALNYLQRINDKHLITLNFVAEIFHQNSLERGMSAVGFDPDIRDPYIHLANQYLPDAKPSGYGRNERRLSFVQNINYSFDQRFNIDFSYNRSGSNNFGVNNPFASYYSFGSGWNMHRETFVRKIKWINNLRLFVNVGISGNENAGGNLSQTTYALTDRGNDFGQAWVVSQYGNPGLNAPVTTQISAGLNLVLLRNLFDLNLNWYNKVTDPLVVNIPATPSMGISNISMNAGKLVYSGMEIGLRIQPIRNKNLTWSIGLNAPLVLKSEYQDFDGAFNKLNDVARNSRTVTRYWSGADADGMYAVRSAGINPSSGRELYLDKNGQYTYTYDAQNEVLIGTSRPKFTGTINSNLVYKKFRLGINMRVVVERMQLNSMLFEKVENIYNLETNLDKRALYDRYFKTGDLAYYRRFYWDEGESFAIPGVTNVSSRYLQEENGVYFESVNIGYDTDGKSLNRLKQKLGLKSLSFNMNFNEFLKFQFTTIKMERGLEYPFSRSVTFSIAAGF